MLKLSIYTFYSFLNKQKSTFILLYLGFFIILFSFLFLFSRYFMIYEQASDENMETKTMNIKLQGILSNEKKEQWIRFILEDSCFSDVKEIMFFDLDNSVIGCKSRDEDVIAIPYGRYFTKEEQQGKNVVLLSEGYLNQCNAAFVRDMLKKQIIIGDVKYTIIGRYNFTLVGNVTSSKEVVIPLDTFVQNKYSIQQIKVVFSTKPKRKQIKAIEEYFNQTGIFYSVQFPTLIEKSAIMQAFEEMGWNLLIIFVCFLCMFPLVQYWNECSYKRLYVYYLCGCSARNTSILLILNTTYLYIISFVSALFFYKCIDNYFIACRFIAKLNVLQIIGCYLVVFILMEVFVKRKMQFYKKDKFGYHDID